MKLPERWLGRTARWRDGLSGEALFDLVPIAIGIRSFLYQVENPARRGQKEQEKLVQTDLQAAHNNSPVVIAGKPTEIKILKTK